MFISFEGPDGAGKTTQIKLLSVALTNLGYDVLVTREPGGTPIADKLRALIISREGANLEPMSEVLMLYAARLEHITKLIKPALEQNKIVLSDRFSDSTVAYQGYGREVSLDSIKKIDSLSLNGFKPDLTLILDIDVKEGLERTKDRFKKNKDDNLSTEDKFEGIDISFHESLRQGFLEIAKKNPYRCHVINASQSIEDLQQDILDLILRSIDTIGGADVTAG